MKPFQAQQLIDWIYREKYTPRGLELSTLAEAREQIRQGVIKPDTAKKLEEIYANAARGGKYENRQRI